MTTGTTANGSENWETFSDNSELEPERDARHMYHAKVNGAAKRMGPAHAFAYSQGHLGMHMAPPPKMRTHDRIEEGDENARHNPLRVEGSDAAWSTEQEEC